MVNTLVSFVVGLAVGIAIMYIGPEVIGNETQELYQSAVQEGQEIIYDRCQKEFFTETSCLQHQSAKVCADMLHGRCGSNPSE